MKNSKKFEGNAFDFYKKVCSKKHSQELKNRLLAMDEDIGALYNSYDHHFNNNSLEQMVSNGYSNQEKEDLEELYDYGCATLQSLKDELTTTENGRVVKCQNCTINDVNTFDHIVPQNEFTEFIIHPKNLFCSCGDCNSRKGKIWRKDGNRTTLNLYLDFA